RQFGAADVMKLEEISMPAPDENQVLVRIKAAGVNPVDTYIRSGTYAQKPSLPYTPGKDGAGIVEKIGANVTKFKVGDRVLTADAGSGTYAEFAVFDEKHLIKLPENVSFEQGAGVFVPYATAYRALFQKAQGKAGETVLVHGASGGVGVAAIQWAKNAGLKVIGTASSDEGKKLVKEQGADFVVDHSAANYLSEILEITGGKGVEIILEMLANVNLQKDFDVLARFGRVSIIGNRGSLEFNPRAIMGKDASVFGLALFNAPDAEMNEIHTAIYDGLSKGFLKPIVGKTFPLENSVDAHRAVIEEKAFGKIVLSI
ncbi:MAG TPA: NADPH:quinone reductase, partial [Pyrinomonadaceae bacterium]|nr:NADPH:quinone reductase [Pyrinomonadaceae bacterium]